MLIHFLVGALLHNVDVKAVGGYSLNGNGNGAAGAPTIADIGNKTALYPSSFSHEKGTNLCTAFHWFFCLICDYLTIVCLALYKQNTTKRVYRIQFESSYASFSVTLRV